MGSLRRIVPVLGVLTVLGLGGVGLGAALAQQDDTPTGSGDDALLERLDVLEDTLPAVIPPAEVTVTADATGGTLSADGVSTRAVLDLVEGDLRRLFVDADEAGGPVAEAVRLVASGWLDIWQGSAHLEVAETNDLAFPLATFDADGVATGADDLRGEIEAGLALILQGRDRLHRGYGTLRELNAAEVAIQARFDLRAANEDTFDAEVRPLVHRLLSLRTTTVLATTDRFRTDAPGVEARARAMSITCLDRDALEAAGGVVTDELLAELEVDRVDCPDLPAGTIVGDGD